MPPLTVKDLHFFSQIVFLDTVADMQGKGGPTVGSLCRHYLANPAGKRYLDVRFSEIKQEYEAWKRFLQEDAKPYHGWRITNIYDDNAPDQSGFYACTFRSPAGEQVLAFRGSELFGDKRYRNDYTNDFSLSYLKVTAQQEKADDYWRRYPLDAAGQGIYLTGHSLGANLATYAAICAPLVVQQQVLACAAFNGPGFNKEFLGSHKEAVKRAKDRIMLIQNEYDVVSSLLKQPTTPMVCKSSFRLDEVEHPTLFDIMYPHSNFLYEFDPQGMPVRNTTGEKSKFCSLVYLLTNLLLEFPVEVRKGLSNLILTLSYINISPKKQGRYLCEAVLKYLSQNEQAAFASRNEEASALYGAAMFLEGSDPSSLYKALSKADGLDSTQEKAQALALLIWLWAGRDN